MKRKKVAVGLSGGVDSSVAAALLIEQGYEVHGVYLECYNEPGCRTDLDKADALKIALQLDLRFKILDFRKEYREKVIEYFYREYETGRTPNPDVVCNREIKFGIFYDWAIEHGYDYVATGHYARIHAVPQLHGDTVTRYIQRARDESKDQSYFLWQIPQDYLGHILFPLGNMLKSEVRAKAREMGLITANKPDSMGICFIGEVDVNKLLGERLGEKVGEVILQCDGDKVTRCHMGKHRGLWFYTIGQRGGWEMGKLNQKTIETLNHLGINTNNMPSLYVIGKDKEKNRLIVGRREATMKKELRIQNLDARMGSSKLFVRIRNLGELVPVTKCHGYTVTLSKPIFGVAEGQSAVFYDKDGVLVGGGTIAN